MQNDDLINFIDVKAKLRCYLSLYLNCWYHVLKNAIHSSSSPSPLVLTWTCWWLAVLHHNMLQTAFISASLSSSTLYQYIQSHSSANTHADSLFSLATTCYTSSQSLVATYSDWLSSSTTCCSQWHFTICTHHMGWHSSLRTCNTWRHFGIHKCSELQCLTAYHRHSPYSMAFEHVF